MMTRRKGARVAWCCAQYPTSCRVTGWTDTEPQAVAEAYAHYQWCHHPLRVPR